MSFLDRIKAKLQLEQIDLDEFLSIEDDPRNAPNLKTTEIVIRYTLNEQDKFVILHYTDILEILRARNELLKKELK